ncbi:MAG TPA: hypothetical protein VMM78_15415 [Thermomicrobiales bacterium]|nr:hypothetical protein [Thermomicrobiales bacterium]
MGEQQPGSDDAKARLRPGAMIRVINQRSPHFGATGHVIGRRDSDDLLIVRFTTLGVTLVMHDDEVDIIRPRPGA